MVDGKMKKLEKVLAFAKCKIKSTILGFHNTDPPCAYIQEHVNPTDIQRHLDIYKVKQFQPLLKKIKKINIILNFNIFKKNQHI